MEEDTVLFAGKTSGIEKIFRARGIIRILRDVGLEGPVVGPEGRPRRFWLGREEDSE